MKLFKYLTIFLLCLVAHVSSDSINFLTDFSFLDELNQAENLASVTEGEGFDRISDLIKDFKKCSQALMDDEENKELTCQLIIISYELLQEIQSKNLTNYFSEEFLRELKTLADIAHKSQTVILP